MHHDHVGDQHDPKGVPEGCPPTARAARVWTSRSVEVMKRLLAHRQSALAVTQPTFPLGLVGTPPPPSSPTSPPGSTRSVLITSPSSPLRRRRPRLGDGPPRGPFDPRHTTAPRCQLASRRHAAESARSASTRDHTLGRGAGPVGPVGPPEPTQYDQDHWSGKRSAHRGDPVEPDGHAANGNAERFQQGHRAHPKQQIRAPADPSRPRPHRAGDGPR